MSLGYAFSAQLRGAAIDLVGKNADGNRDGDVLDGEEGEFVFPIQTSRRDRRVRQPVERDVVEDVVSREALGCPAKTRAMSASLLASWSRIQAARPTGESAIP